MAKYGWRFLRSYMRVAWWMHTCSSCPLPIMPGDEYEADVQVWKGLNHETGQTISYLRVDKRHFPFCPWDEEAERENMEESESLYDEDREDSSEEMPEAA